MSESPQPTSPQTQATIPRFSESSISKLKSQGLTQMEHYIGRNLEDRGGLGRVKEVARNYVESLGDLATDRPPSCHEPDIPGQGTKQRDQHLKTDKRKDEYMKEINHKMISTSVNTCNSCNHDLPPEDREYAEMEDTPFIVEDCVSRCPSNLPEPTQEELDIEKDWEPDPPPHLDLKILAAKSAKLQVRPERICHLEGEQICMNMMFGPNEV